MPVSFEHAFVFVHIPKTGGTSIEEALSRCGVKLALIGMSTEEERGRLGITEPWLHHIPAVELRRILGASRWDSYFSFAFVRNPWDRLVSLYHFLHKQFAARPDLQQAFPAIAARLKTSRTFGEWLAAGASPAPQLDLIVDPDGRKLVDFVGRYEHLERDFGYVQRRIGVTASLPHLLRSQHPPYRDCYDDETRELVARNYRRDIEAFGYQF
jgi:hypothetical protein